jgi:PIN domain nuclease of toxin-antitoxin system
VTSAPVFDTSALLAYFLDEKGSDRVENLMSGGGILSAANWSELAQKIGHMNIGWPLVREHLKSSGFTVEPVTQQDAEAAALLWRPGAGLSLADRLCLSLGQRLGCEVVTADTAWGTYPGVTVIR